MGNGIFLNQSKFNDRLGTEVRVSNANDNAELDCWKGEKANKTVKDIMKGCRYHFNYNKNAWRNYDIYSVEELASLVWTEFYSSKYPANGVRSWSQRAYNACKNKLIDFRRRCIGRNNQYGEFRSSTISGQVSRLEDEISISVDSKSTCEIGDVTPDTRDSVVEQELLFELIDYIPDTVIDKRYPSITYRNFYLALYDSVGCQSVSLDREQHSPKLHWSSHFAGLADALGVPIRNIDIWKTSLYNQYILPFIHEDRRSVKPKFVGRWDSKKSRELKWNRVERGDFENINQVRSWVMKRAHSLRKSNIKESWGDCLRLAWSMVGR